MAFTPTPEQAAIVHEVVTTNDNLLISALAGAAKTSTLVLIAEAKPQTAMLCLAFNKRIATEMQERLPSTCTAKTLNALGHQAWQKFLNKKFLQLDSSKVYRLTKEVIDELARDLSEDEARTAYGALADCIRFVDRGKIVGWIPDDHYPYFNHLVNDEDFLEILKDDDEITSFHWDVIKAVTLRSLKEAHEGTIDFNDQILCSALSAATFTQYPITLVDEAQDLSSLNHVMLAKIVGKKRVIAVGDECQSIYAFRGADTDSMKNLSEQFSMRRLVLSVSFRCPIKVVEEARWRAPHMQYPEWAKEGEVRILASWGPDDIPQEAAILCRNNAPLFSLAFRLLKARRFPELVGSDIGKALIKTLKSFGKSSMPSDDVKRAITEWAEAKKKKVKNRGRVDDQADCLRVFADQGKTLGDAIAYAEHILAQTGPIKLMTGHKSKGLEFESVFILDQSLIGEDQQDKNLRYVMQTRAKSTLTYVTSDTFSIEGQPE